MPTGHLQTLAGVFLPAAQPAYVAVRHYVALGDGDCVVLHDDCPSDWNAPNRTALLVHGLSGCYESGYMQRIAAKLCQRGIRAFRMDLRGCGAGADLARLPYHSGRSDDAARAIRYIAALCPDSPVTLIGFSLGANIVLKLLGEIGSDSCGGLDSGIAACPPVDLCECSRNLSRWSNRIYDAHFVSSLWRALRLKANASNGSNHAARLQGIRRAPLKRRPVRLFEFDDAYTAPVSGFRDAEHYYRTCSCGQFIPAIRKPTLVIAAADDPMIPLRLLDRIEWPSCTQVHIAGGGGHLGFIGCGGVDPDYRWMDWRIVEWTAGLAVDR